MKVKSSKLLVCWLLFLAISSCNKDDSLDKETIIQREYLIIDSTSTLHSNIEEINKVVSVDLFVQTMPEYQLDLNNDSINDIEFVCSVFSRKNFDQWGASIKTLNDKITINIDSPQTVLLADYFYNIETSPGHYFTIAYFENYQPTKQYPSNLEIDTIFVNNPTIHFNGDTLSEKCNCKSGLFTLASDNRMTGGYINNISLGKWIKIDSKFIGVRFSENSKPYYGWIELSVNGYEISLHRFGLQNDVMPTTNKETITDID